MDNFHINQVDHMNLVIHHVFLIKQLPQKKEDVNLSGMLVQFMFNYLPTTDMPMMGLKSVQFTMDKWKYIQSSSVSDSQISEVLHALQPGQTFVIYVQPHNSVITIRRSETDLNNALMSVFRASASNEMVMTEGDLFHTFPERAVWIPFNRFLYRAFSIQLALLCNENFELPIETKDGSKNFNSLDVAEPIFVISWLLGAMSGTLQGEINFVCVQKVIRDDILCTSTNHPSEKASENPWRRSGEWFAIKCVLQIILVTELGSVEGIIVYKSMMIYIMASFLDNLPSTFDDNDIIMQMLSKVSRRMAKLESRIGKHNFINLNREPCKQSMDLTGAQWVKIVFNKAHDVLFKKRNEVDARWSKHIKACCELFSNISELHACDQITHKMSKNTIDRLNYAFHKDLSRNLQIKVPRGFDRWNPLTLFDINFLVSAERNDQIEETLWDFEVWVKELLWNNFTINIASFVKHNSQIFDLLCKYFEIGLRFYENDAVGSSRMIMTMLLVLAGLDSIAKLEWPLLSDYHSSFEESYFDNLLIQHFDDMKYLQLVRTYFITRNMDSKYPSIMSEHNVNSLGCRIANENKEMQLKREEILMYTKQQQEKKTKEFEDARNLYDFLMHEFNKAIHDEDEKRTCKLSCNKCRIVRRFKSISVCLYENPIPEDCIWKQNAIVFELSIPNRIRCLRDSLFIFHRGLNQNQFDKIKVQLTWKSHEQLVKWVDSECKKSIVSIGSTTYNYLHNCLLNQQTSINDILKPCSLTINLFMHHGHNQKFRRKVNKFDQLKPQFFSLKLTNDLYNINTSWVTGTTHTENEVLASQYKCPLNLRLDEFKAFGSLRAGHRLQLRKILRCFEMHSLSFENSSVFALIAQALWQAGPAITENVNDPVLFFESHSDLHNDGFCFVLIDCLSTFLENISENWKKHSQLQLVIILALRMFSLSSEKVRVRVIILLKRCRCIAQTWANQIESLLSGVMASSLSEIHKVRLKLIDVAAYTALTFDVDRYHESVINKDTFCIWLQAVSRIHDNILLDSSNNSHDFERRNLLRRVRIAALRLETIGIKILALDNFEIFNKFLSLKWPEFSKGVCENQWMPYTSPAQAWYHNKFNIFEYRSVTLQINILSGKFLVDGNPIGKLPEKITKSPDYERVFGHHIFEVRPAAERTDSFVSVHAIQGSIFIFSLGKHELVVVERRSSGEEYELMPFNIFKDNFPYVFVNKYSHWMCKQNKFLVFRPVKFSDPEFFKVEHGLNFSFQFDVQKRTLYNFERKRYLVDIQSDTFHKVYNCTGLKRIEKKQHIHLWLNTLEKTSEKEQNNFVFNVELPRMDLYFKFEEKTGKLFSCEYNGLIVSQIQGGFGTLIGLKNGLLLCEDERLNKTSCQVQRRVLIIPHTKNIELIKSESFNHHIVKFKLTELSSPPYFTYEIDDRLCELKGPAFLKAWLYISLLHAMTSSSVPDPFTKLTGTESSIRLLQMGRTFSCKPLEVDELHYLKLIANLAPKRTFNSNYFMSSVTWLKNLQSSYAFDSLGLATKVLQKRADVYKDLYLGPNIENLKKKKKKKKDLTIRAYWRYRNQLNSCARLHVESEKAIGGFPKRKLAWSFINDYNCLNFKVSRLIMEICYQNYYIIPSNLWNVVKQFKTIKNKQISTESFLKSCELNAINSYLFLYELAQKVYKKRFCRFQFALKLSLLAFNGGNKDLLFSLLAVAILGVEVNPPSERNYKHPNETDFDLEVIRLAIEKEIVSLDVFIAQYDRKEKSPLNLTNKIYESLKGKALETLSDIAASQWKFRHVNFGLKCDDIVNIYKVEIKINKLFTRWDNNAKLKTFFDQVEMSIMSKTLFTKTGTKEENDILVPPFSNSKMYTLSPGPYDPTFSIKNLPENLDAINLFTKKYSGDHSKTSSNTDIKIPSEKIHSIFDIADNNNDAIIKYMKNAFDLSHYNIGCSSLQTLNHSGFKREQIGFKTEHNDFKPELNGFKINVNDIDECLIKINKKIKEFRKEVSDAMKPDDIVEDALLYGGLWRRMTPVVLVPCILPLTSFSLSLLLLDNKNSVPQSIINRIGALVVCWTAEQKAIRCLKLLKDNSPAFVLSRELENLGHENWIPASNPEWLILELEGNFLIRPIQIDIAQSMLDANENFVQQLNMGEGKTSVIVPLLAVTLATSEQLARVTVLRSLLNRNYESLVEKLGGLLNKRVYIVPCCRKMTINPLKILNIHQECLDEHGLMLTTPEYRLSLELKTLEHCAKRSEDALQLYGLRCWLRKYARDVLDESDEILNVKYQMVYTLGEQLLVDGGELRWIISQAILSLVNKFADELSDVFENTHIEYKFRCADSFSHIRFLSNDTDMYKYLCNLIADAILNNGIPEVSEVAKLGKRDKNLARIFITSNKINLPGLNKRLIKLFEMNSILKEELLILRGLLCFEVLHTALQKRWRVHFGVNPMSSVTKMAVPFRAKDVAAEQTEFGHPDTAIILTQISYYMSGLNEDQLDEVFQYLDKCSFKDAEYERWIEAIGIINVPKYLHVLNGVNLDNVEQRIELYSILQYSMNVINFWLNRTVYPREAKQFPHIMSTSAWDLCLSKDGFGNGIEKCTTGFSGTNESELLLPLTINSNNLPQTQGTNAMVLSYLLQSENNAYYYFKSSKNTLDECILNKMVKTSARVLIDVGALMLQMDNKNVAQEWLKMVSPLSVSAAVFFDKDDKIMAIDRKGSISQLSISPYYHQLDKCIFYIDDFHTRGTDLKFPFNTLACVTLGKGLTKDRLVQACMRLRLLGNGHKTYFYAANDVHLSIVQQIKLSLNVPGSADVLRWAINNSCNAIRDGLLHWAYQGLCRATKDAVESLLYSSTVNRKIKPDDLAELGTRCREDSVISLNNLYGESRLLESASNTFKKSLATRVELFNKDDATKPCVRIINLIGADISARCDKYLSKNKSYDTAYDDEQERELETELEEEFQNERPGPQNPHKPKLSQEVRDLVEKGLLYHNSLEILNIDNIFENTNRLSKLFLKGCWNPGLKVTKEFTMVIEDNKEGDNFLFEISWLILVPTPNCIQCILISSFEANELLPIFRSTQNCFVKLHMFAPRLRRGQNIFINQSSLALPDSNSILFGGDIISQLTVLGGGLFFISDLEQDAYCETLGILPNISDLKDVTNMPTVNNFEEEKKMVKVAIEILRTRGRCVHSTSSHACQLLLHGIRSSINNPGSIVQSALVKQ